MIAGDETVVGANGFYTFLMNLHGILSAPTISARVSIEVL
jgi:hypothetical protein